MTEDKKTVSSTAADETIKAALDMREAAAKVAEFWADTSVPSRIRTLPLSKAAPETHDDAPAPNAGLCVENDTREFSAEEKSAAHTTLQKSATIIHKAVRDDPRDALIAEWQAEGKKHVARLREIDALNAAITERNMVLAEAKGALDQIFLYVSYINVHGMGYQPEPSVQPQPMHVEPTEFLRIFQYIGKRASEASAAIKALKGGAK